MIMVGLLVVTVVNHKAMMEALVEVVLDVLLLLVAPIDNIVLVVMVLSTSDVDGTNCITIIESPRKLSRFNVLTTSEPAPNFPHLIVCSRPPTSMI